MHEKLGDGKSAIDFMKEITKPNWHIINNSVEKVGEYVFCPFFYKGELGCKDNSDAIKKVMSSLPDGRILFAHHAFSGMKFPGFKTDELNEVVLDSKKLESKFELCVAGHIHTAYKKGKFLVTGSVFNNELGDEGKKIFKITDSEAGVSVEDIDIPGRKIVKLENPEKVEVKKGFKNPYEGNIIKVFLTDEKYKGQADLVKESIKLLGADAVIVVEQYKNKRGKNSLSSSDSMTFTTEELLELYAKDNKIDKDKLMRGFTLIKQV